MGNKDLPRCGCGKLISSGKMRDFYLHILESHANAVVIGIPCDLCKELIPFGLAACHQFIDHKLEPPIGADFRNEMESDYRVLGKIKKSKIKIVTASP